MPDPARLTISSTQSPALWDASPYITKWMLYHHFKGLSVDDVETSRMSWGKALEPLVLAKARDELGIEIEPNLAGAYLRSEHAPIGCTVDALANDPQRGRGVVEVKCVFDYRTWMTEWGGGKSVPRNHEIQLQHHMTVGDGKIPYQWGCFAVWVCAELHYFQRERDGMFTNELYRESKDFMTKVERSWEPEPFGEPVEADLLRRVFPTVADEVLDLRLDAKAHQWADHVRMLDDFRDKETFYKKAAAKARLEFMAVAKSAGKVLLPGAQVSIKSVPMKGHTVAAHVQQRVSIHLSDDPGETAEMENPFA